MNVFRYFQGAALIAACTAPFAPMPAASAQPPCPDVEVVFARGTYEPPGVGGPGQSFVDALRARTGERSVEVYPVNYQASGNFGDRIEFARTVVDGIRDASDHVKATARDCPKTKVVLGGYSQGAVVAGYTTAATVPDGIPAEYKQFIPEPMAPEIADHVASVVLLGTPSDEFMRDIGAPPMVIGQRYKDKTIELCEPGDTICDGTPAGVPNFAHTAYVLNGMPGQAADFTVGRL